MDASISDSTVDVTPFLLGLAWMISTFIVYLLVANMAYTDPYKTLSCLCDNFTFVLESFINVKAR